MMQSMITQAHRSPQFRNAAGGWYIDAVEELRSHSHRIAFVFP